MSSVAASTSESPPRATEAQPADYFWLKVGGAGLLTVVLLGVYLHKDQKLTIYSDYTDAAFTGMAPLAAIATYYLLAFFEVPVPYSLYCAVGIFGLLLIFIFRSTAKHNNGFTVYFLVALITKLAIVGAFYLSMVFVVFFFQQSARKKGERKDRYETRLRREHKVSMATMAAFAGGCVAMLAWMCRSPEFSNLQEYFSPPASNDRQYSSEAA